MLSDGFIPHAAPATKYGASGQHCLPSLHMCSYNALLLLLNIEVGKQRPDGGECGANWTKFPLQLSYLRWPSLICIC